MGSATQMDVVMNFMALDIVAQFDDFFFAASVPSVLKDAIKEGGAIRKKFSYLYTITKTTAEYKEG